MKIGVAQAREHFREILDRVGDGEVVEVTRRDKIVAVIAPPSAGGQEGTSFGETVRAWREEWRVASWPDDDPFADVRDRAHGREAPW